MIRAYQVFSAVVYALVYWFGRMRARQGDLLWRDRLAIATYNTPVDLWLHAASVGEVRVVNCLITFLAKERPDVHIHLTVMTRTGFQTARTLFGSEIDVSYLPLDVPWLMRRKLRSVRPKALVIAETEIWPNLILEAGAAAIPVVLVNGRMSERAFKKYRLLEGSFRTLLSSYRKIFVKSQGDGDRIGAFLSDSERLVVAGDMKFDAPLHDRSGEKRQSMRAKLGLGEREFLFVAGSTREGEETILTDAYLKLKTEFPGLRLLIAPRHLERVTEVAAIIENAGLRIRSVDSDTPSSADAITLVDRMGLLNDLYAAADLAFVGGTLVDIGGHNILEPIWAGTPVLYGPFLSNVRDASEYILAHNFGAVCQSPDDLAINLGAVMRGQVHFAVKTEETDLRSATSLCGSYLLELLDNG
jgi:3-deoxy-D-manno-octulosonic-acid transferase